MIDIDIKPTRRGIKSSNIFRAFLNNFPDYPIIFFAGNDAVRPDWVHTDCERVRIKVKDLLLAEVTDDGEYIESRKELAEWVWRDMVRDLEGRNPTEDEYRKHLEKITELCEPYWRKVIAVYVDN